MPLAPQEKARLEHMAVSNAGIEKLSPQERRAFRKAQPSAPGPAVHKAEDRLIPGPAGEVPVRIYSPDGTGPFPALVWFHGGGWVIGDIDTFDGTARHLCVGANCVIVSVDYRLAPENKFPAAAEDCYAATQWTVKNASQLNVDPSRVAVGGDSAGGNLAAVVSLIAREKGEPAPAFQVLVYPVTDYDFTTNSYRENGTDYGLTKDDMVWYWNHYLRSEEDASNPYAAPAQAKDLKGLPPALVITAEYDPLCDEGADFAKRLKEAGVSTTYTCYEGVGHGFFANWAIVYKGKRAVEQVCSALKEALAGQTVRS